MAGKGSGTDHLYENAPDDHDPKHICANVRQLVVARKSQFERDSKALQVPVSAQLSSKGVSGTHLDSHDRDTADERADREVDHGVLVAIHGDDLVNHVKRKDRDDTQIEEEGGLRGIGQDLIDRLDFFIGWSVEDDNEGSDLSKRADERQRGYSCNHDKGWGRTRTYDTGSTAAYA